MKKLLGIFFVVSALLAGNVFAHYNPASNGEILSKMFDPQEVTRIVYENPRGCDEVSGTITLKASVQGEGVPAPAAMRYELRTSEEGEPILFTGNSPTYEVSFDTTQMRDGFVFYKVIPLDNTGNEINIKASPYNAPGIIPPYRGFMINNHNLNLSKPLIVLGTVLEPYSEETNETWTAEQLKDHLTFSLNLMTHLKHLGFIPNLCFSDETTIVLDPSNPLANPDNPPSNFVDLMGESVEGTPTWNEGTACLQSPFYEIPVTNGILDIWEHTALDNVRFYDEHGHVDSKPEAINFFEEIVERLTCNYNLSWDYYNILGFEEPVKGEDPKNLLKDKLADAISDGATSVWMYDFYLKANDFEMSAGAWPHFQESIDEANEESETSIYLGAITTNDYQIMHYDNLLRALYLGVRELVKTSDITADKKVGIIIAGHGSGTTNRIYDVSAINNPVMEELIENYFSTRMAGIYSAETPYVVCYSEHANSPDDGLNGVGEQVQQWVNEGFDYVFVFPMEWSWASREVWENLRIGAIELIDEDNEEIFTRDERGRSEVTFEDTHLIVGETIFEQKAYNPSSYHFLRAAGVQLLEDRLIELTSTPGQKTLSGKVSIEGEGIDLSLDFSDSLLAKGGKITLQNAGVRAEGITLDFFILGFIIGTLDKEDMANYVFALLAENTIEVESVEVEQGNIILLQIGPDFLSGSINAQASVQVAGQDINLKIAIEIP